MTDEKFKIMLQGYIDGELTPPEREEVRLAIEESPECRTLYREFLALKNLTNGIRLKVPDSKIWEGYMSTLYGRIERGTGWILLSLGAILLLGYGGYHLVLELIKDKDMPLIVKTGMLGVLFGIIILFVSVMRERIIARKTDVYREIEQ